MRGNPNAAVMARAHAFGLILRALIRRATGVRASRSGTGRERGDDGAGAQNQRQHQSHEQLCLHALSVLQQYGQRNGQDRCEIVVELQP